MLSGSAVFQDGFLIIKPDQPPGDGWFEHIKTLNNGKEDWFRVQYEETDPRKVRPKQRALFFALLHDIWNWSGEDEDYLKTYFYSRYMARTGGKAISLADTSQSTVSDATELINDVVDFIFKFDVPIKAGMYLLPKDENHFQYQCIAHRKCLICGQHADIHHVDEIGAGRNRNQLDHTQFRLAALCREHHTEFHQVGPSVFCNKYHLTNLGVKVDHATLKRIGIQGR